MSLTAQASLQVLGVRSVEELEYHMWPKGDYAWDHIPRTAYAEHSHDACPECGASRLLQDTLKPVKVRLLNGAKHALAVAGLHCPARGVQHILLRALLYTEHGCATWGPPLLEPCGMYTLMHVQVYYGFGLAKVIGKLFQDPDWTAARGKGRDTSPGGFYGSPEAARPITVMRGLFGRDSSSAYEL